MVDSDAPQARPLIEFSERRADNGQRIILTQTNTGELTKPLQREIQEVLDTARLTVEAVRSLESFSGDFADATVRLHPANNRRLALGPLKALTVERTLRSAFRDVMEGVLLFLDDCRGLLAVWSLPREVLAEQFVRKTRTESDRFHRLGLREKFRHLTEVYNFSVDDGAVDILDSLNRARNCVVHRKGIVGSHDMKRGTKALRAVWRETAMFAGPDPAKFETLRRVNVGDVIEHPDYLVVGQTQKVVEYPLGSRIVFTTQDLSEVCDTVLIMAKHIRSKLDEHARLRGIPTGDAAASPKPSDPRAGD